MYLIDKFVNATLYIFVQIGLEKMATEHTRLIYMTTGVLLQKLVQAKSLTEFSHIFVDEVHKPDVKFFMFICVSLLATAKKRGNLCLFTFYSYFGGSTNIKSDDRQVK